MISKIECTACNSFFNAIKAKALAFQNGVANCCSTDTKIYTLVITGRLLQVAAIAATSFFLLGTIVIGPVALFGMIASVALGILGTFMVGHVMDHVPGGVPPGVPGGTGIFPGVPAIVKPFVPGQPSGLINSTGNNCWLNAAMQCMIHVPALRQRVAFHPQLEQFVQQYQQRQTSSQAVAQGLDVESLKGYINQELHLDRLREAGPVNGHVDASVIMNWLLRQPAFHQFSQTWTRPSGASTSRMVDEPLMELDLSASPTATAAQHVARFFEHDSDHGRIRLTFNALPPVLAVKLKRFHMHFPTPEDRLRMTPHYAKISHSVDGLDRLTIPAAHVALGQEGNYACQAFIVHYGNLEGGHYVAYIKREGKWWCCNDSSVNEVSEQQALIVMKNAYFCFYNRLT